MTNRLELNWKLDGFVDEQRYYCSETPIDPLSLPVPKAILTGDVQAYSDTDIEINKTYYVCIGAVKNNVEKLSDILSESTVVDTAPTLIAYSDTAYANANSVTNAVPSIAATGDLLVAVVMHRNPLSIPSGWTQVATHKTANNIQSLTVLSKTKGLSDSSVTFSQSVSALIAACIVVARHEKGCRIDSTVNSNPAINSNGEFNVSGVALKNCLKIIAANRTSAAEPSSYSVISSGYQSIPPFTSFDSVLRIRQFVAIKAMAANDSYDCIFKTPATTADTTSLCAIAVEVTANS